MTKIERNFKQPKPEYRSAPFWSWNDDLTEKELKRQLDEMKKGGMVGGFIHSRMGLITPYLSREWMKLTRSTVRHARKIGVPVYLYDEDRFPSGFAGGSITRNKKYGMKILTASKLNSKKSNNGRKWKFETGNTPRIGYYNRYLNNAPYLDTLNEKAVGEFIRSTYVPYKKEVGSEFNKTVPAIFTDEPNYLFLWFLTAKDKSYLPWTEGLDKIFKKRYGYNLREHLISLIEAKGDYKKIRYNFIKLVSELFLKNYGKQIYDWCEKNSISLTGHYLMEDSLTSQIRVTGAVMPCYEYMHLPGVDHLTRSLVWQDHTILTIKQCSSVAHQLDKERVLSELFGCSGQNMNFTDRKWIGNWNTVQGVNLFCPHLWLYSLAGDRKRDYPPTISHQQPYWKYNKPIEDYFARINYITNQGKYQADVLVIHPMESAWCLYSPSNTKAVDKINDKFISMLKNLSGRHYDYDLGDESLLAKYGKIDQGLFKVGQMDYRSVVVPPVVNLKKTTIDLLNSFIDKGGKVIGFSPIPNRIEGLKASDRLHKQLYSRIIVLPDPVKVSVKKNKDCSHTYRSGLISAVKTIGKRSLSIANINKGKATEIEDIYYQHRVLDKETDLYFMANNNREKEYQARITIPALGKSVLEIWDPMTGEICELKEAVVRKDSVSCDLYFPGAGSHILIKRKSSKKSRALSGRRFTGKQANGIAGYKQNSVFTMSKKKKEITKLPPSKWVCEEKGLNSLTIDYCQYKTGGMKAWSRPAYVLDVQENLKKKLKNNMPFSVRYAFKTSLNKKPEPVFLILERPEQFEIKVNGSKIAYKDTGYWLDISFKKLDITDHIKLKGQNIIELKSKFKQPTKPRTLIFVKGGTEIESVYLRGNFNVTGKFTDREECFIGREFTVVDARAPVVSNTIKNGYPFYTGRFVFSQEFNFSGNIPKRKRIYLYLDDMKAITLKIRLNKKDAGLILWPPYCLDITDMLKKGKNRAEIELTGSLHNLLGPHHCSHINKERVGPPEFNDKENWMDGYALMPFGLKGSVKISYLPHSSLWAVSRIK